MRGSRVEQLAVDGLDASACAVLVAARSRGSFGCRSAVVGPRPAPRLAPRLRAWPSAVFFAVRLLGGRLLGRGFFAAAVLVAGRHLRALEPLDPAAQGGDLLGGREAQRADGALGLGADQGR